jgi:hypothetical protein
VAAAVADVLAAPCEAAAAFWLDKAAAALVALLEAFAEAEEALVTAFEALKAAPASLAAAFEALRATPAALPAALLAETPADTFEIPAKVAEAEASAASAVKRVISESVVELPPPPTPRNIVILLLS